jgi:hypothetical protein
MTRKKAASRNLTFAIPVKLTPAIDEKIVAAAKETGLKKSDVIRMSVERGVEVLLAQLNSNPNAA